MASPADPTHPLTPPAEVGHSVPSASQQQNTSQPAHDTSTSNHVQRTETLLSQPLTSLDDTGQSKRPRDHRLIHLLLASHGVSAYQERVPLQLMDFAYRYTSSVLSDAVHIQNEGYNQASNESGGASTGRGKKSQQNKNADDGDISLSALRFSIGSRLGYQMSGTLPKEFLKQLADERNRVSLTTHSRDVERGGSMVGGVKLPHEKYCLTGVGWGLKDEWESEGEESVEDASQTNGNGINGDSMQVDTKEPTEDMEDEGDEEGLGTMEDVFGPEGGGKGDDQEMLDS